MASFIPLVLTEEETWQVWRYMQSFGQQQVVFIACYACPMSVLPLMNYPADRQA